MHAPASGCTYIRRMERCAQVGGCVAGAQRADRREISHGAPRQVSITDTRGAATVALRDVTLELCQEAMPLACNAAEPSFCARMTWQRFCFSALSLLSDR